MISRINNFLKSYWLKEPSWGLRRIIIFYIVFSILIFVAWWKQESLFLSFSLLLSVSVSIFIVKRGLIRGYAHRLEEVDEFGEKLRIHDHIFPLEKLKSTRLFGVGDELLLYGRAFLSKNQNKKRSCFLDIAAVLFEKLVKNKEKARCLFLGGGGCVIPLFLASKYPKSKNDVVEISHKVIWVAKKYFFPLFGQKDYANLRIFNDDAYDFLQKNNDGYDFILQDIFLGKELPSKFISQEWLNYLQKHLRKEGIIIINAGIINSKNCLSFIFLLLFNQPKRLKFSLYLYGKNIVVLLTRSQIFIEKAQRISRIKKYEILAL